VRITKAVGPADDAEDHAGDDALLTGVHLYLPEPEALVEAASGVAIEHSEREEGAAALARLRLRPREQQLADALAARGGADADLLDVGLPWLCFMQAILVLSNADIAQSLKVAFGDNCVARCYYARAVSMGVR
jgi:hypothetical protein